MNHRLEQLRVLLDRLERMPASPNRDWMMVEVRARAADIEVGVRPEPLRSRDGDAAIRPTEATGPARAKLIDAVASPATRSRPGTIVPPTGARAVEPPQPAPAPPRGAVSAVSGVAVSAPVEPTGPARVAAADDPVGLLEHGGVLCLGEPPAEARVDAHRPASPPWARGLRG